MIRWILILLLCASAVMGADKYPSMKVFKIGNIYDNFTVFKQSVYFYGANMDAMVNGAGVEYVTDTMYFDKLKMVASDSGWTIETYAYTNFHMTYLCGDSTADTSDGGINLDWYRTMAETDAQSGIRESMFLHNGDDSIWQTGANSGASCPGYSDALTRLGDSGWSITNRFSQGYTLWNDSTDYAYPSNRLWGLNIHYSKADSIRANVMLNILDNPVTSHGLDSTMDGYYCDNSMLEAAYWLSYWGLDSTKGGATGGAGWSNLQSDVDFLEYASPNGNKAAYYVVFTDFHKAIADTLMNHGYRVIPNFTNSAWGYLDDLTILGGSVVSDVYFETRLGDVILEKWSSLASGDLARMDVCITYPEMRNYWELRILNGTQAADTGNSHTAHSGFAAFMTIQDTSSYFCITGRFGANDDTLYWTNYDLFQVDLGAPIGPTRSLFTGGAGDTTTGGEAVHFLYREYENGYAYGLPKEEYASDTTASNTFDYDLGADTALYVLGDSEPGHASDSTYKADGIITIRPMHWGIALKASDPPVEAPPTINTVLPTSGYVDSTDGVGATIFDFYALDSIGVYVRTPSAGSTAVFDTTFASVVTSYSTTHDYTWLEAGDYDIIHVVIDTAANTTRDSTTITISTASAGTSLPTKITGLKVTGVTVR